MNFSKKTDINVHLDITALVDVVFLLLIFFMVSTTFEQHSQISITLPFASKEVESESVKNKINIVIDAEENIYINEQAVINAKINTLKQALSQESKHMDAPSIIINADSKASHQSVIRVMDAARQLNLTKIIFATQELDE